MAKELRIRRGTTAQHSTFTGAPNEVTADTTKKTLVLHDGVTAGGTPLATEASVTSLSNSITTGLAGKQDADAELTTLAGMSANRATFLASNHGFGFRNRIINGAMQVSQRAANNNFTQGTAVPTSSTGYRSVDRFFMYCTSGSGTVMQVSDGAGGLVLRVMGNFSPLNVGVGQRIEQRNSFDLAGSTATLSVDLATFASQPVTWTVSYADTADTFGTIGTPTKTQIATGTFATTTTLTRYTAQGISIPSAATTGIEVLLTVGSLSNASDTWTIANIQFEPGSVATPFERRPFGTELALCQRYYEAQAARQYVSYNTSTVPQILSGQWSVAKRITPTVTAASTVIAASNINTAQAVGSVAWNLGQSGAGVTGGVCAGTILGWAEL